MKHLFITLLTLGFSAGTFAADVELITAKDWSAYMGVSEILGNKDVCAASTMVTDQKTGAVHELSVMKTAYGDGTYSSPFVMISSTGAPAVLYKGTLKTDGSSKVYSMTLLQSASAEKAILSRYADSNNIISALKAQNSVKVEMSGTAGVPAMALPFSLSGSSKVISEMEKQCK